MTDAHTRSTNIMKMRYLMSAGFKQKHIAEILEISQQLVSYYRRIIFESLVDDEDFWYIFSKVGVIE